MGWGLCEHDPWGIIRWRMVGRDRKRGRGAARGLTRATPGTSVSAIRDGIPDRIGVSVAPILATERWQSGLMRRS